MTNHNWFHSHIFCLANVSNLCHYDGGDPNPTTRNQKISDCKDDQRDNMAAAHRYGRFLIRRSDLIMQTITDRTTATLGAGDAYTSTPGSIFADAYPWPNNYSSPPPPPPPPAPPPPLPPPPPVPDYQLAASCDLHNGGGSAWHVQEGYGRVPEARIECFVRPLDYVDETISYPVCVSQDCCHGFVMKRDWTKWLCMTQDMVDLLDDDVQAGKRFANGGVSPMGQRLR